ncbi:nuclear transport factor 2 family protein [Saccharopolyspora sp. NFXS83]|uniref:nuclear transport factor 2 family protein n=1 Tax=Saccharopolyspora sp. NFXS83 TaxID=2993560 RepID=UPI00224A8BC0|nr:nuclear transport factor 2 family protein [Saccharopolyspora sp. NFXS83]MCX2729270.1 nuclear transport factor 2 family protein [Saccharopolyspora sp. NFXS83]
MTIEQNRESAQRLVEGLSTGRLSDASDILDAAAVWTVMADPSSFPVSGSMSKVAFIEHMEHFHASLPDAISVTVTNVIADEAGAAVEAVSRARLHNGKHLDQAYHFAFEFRDAKVVAAREYIDTARALAAFSE